MNKLENVSKYQHLGNLMDGVFNSYDELGNLQAVLRFDNEQLNGIARFYQGTELSQVAKFKDGKLNGRMLIYQDGIITTYCSYKDGKLNGAMITFYESKKIKTRLNYLLGRRNGPYRCYDTKGNKINEANYKDDKLDGFNILYYPNGEIIKKEKYEMGKLIEVSNA